MPTKDNNIIKYNHGEKSMKVPFIIYVDLECLLEKMSTCINNPNESSTTKINQHTPSGYSIFTSCSFYESKNKLNYYRGKDCMKKFCKDLKEHATRIINHEKKKIIPLTKEEKINYNDQKICYICKKEFDTIDKKNYKVRDHCHYTGKYGGAAHNICNLRYKVPKEIPVVFHNGSTYDYHFIIKELVKKFEGNLDCLGESTEKYITFSVPLKKKIENKNLEITYKIKFIDSFRFMSSSLSKLVDNLSEEIHNNKCADCTSNLDYIKITAKPSSLEHKNEKLILECYNCKQRYRKKFNKELIKRFASTYKFCNNDLNKLILLLRKGVYPYEYADTWEKFSEISLPSKEDFHSNLNIIIKTSIKSWIKVKKIHRIIEFNQEAWLKPYIDMNTELGKLARNDFEKDLFKLMNNSVFGKTMENIRKHRDIKLVTTDKKRSKLVSEPNYHIIDLISEDLSIIEMKKTKVKMNKPIYLGLSILEISKILMYEFWYDYMKPKYNDNVRLCYMDTDSFIMNIKTNDFYKDISDDVDNRFDTSNYEVKRPLPIGKKKVIGLMKDELGGEIITEFIALKPKTYSYLTDNDKIDKKAKGTKKCVIKKMIKFDDYKKCLLNDKVILKSQQRFISNKHDVYTEDVNKIA